MRYATFMTTVEQAAGITREQADRAVRATLETLAERITAGEADDIALFLPPEVRPLVTVAPPEAEAFGLDEFVRRVAEREGVDERTARDHARAVFVALGEAVAPGELRDMAAQLPRDFEEMLDAAGVGRRQAIPDDDVVGRVARRIGCERDLARRVADAVLEALAIRISAGEAEDLEAELPPDLHPAIQRGLAQNPSATLMTADEFVAAVAERAGASLEDAEEYARAVFGALREVVSGKEFADMAAQLSRDFEPLLAARR
jgi:uncharacterized protein (DUF2267 family)